MSDPESMDDATSTDSDTSSSSLQSGSELNESEHCNYAWSTLLSSFFDFCGNDIPKNYSSLTSEPTFTEFVYQFATYVKLMRKVMNLIEDSELWNAVDKTKRRLVQEEGYNKSDAYIEAWLRRKQLVRELLNNMLHSNDQERNYSL